MIRCAWCGAKNYAIDMWCARCHRHLDWEPTRPQTGTGRRTLGLLAPAAAVVGVALLLLMPAASSFSGSLLAGHFLPLTGLAPTSSSSSRPLLVASPKATPTPQAGLLESTPPADSGTPTPTTAPPEVAILPGAPPLQGGSTITARVAQPAPVSAGDPVAAIRAFYSAVTAHQFGAAASTWSGPMQAAYPPPVYINRRFSATQYIGLTSDRVLSDVNGAAVVYVTVSEVIGGQKRVWIGTWQLIDTSSGWLLNNPNLQAG